MVTLSTDVSTKLNDAQEGESFWLIGSDWNYVINSVKCENLDSSKFVQSLLPGGMSLIGVFMATAADQDFIDMAKKLDINPATFIQKAKTMKAFTVEGPVLAPKTLSVDSESTVNNMILLTSRAYLPVYGLDQMKLFGFVNNSALFQINGQYFDMNSEHRL